MDLAGRDDAVDGQVLAALVGLDLVDRAVAEDAVGLGVEVEPREQLLQRAHVVARSPRSRVRSRVRPRLACATGTAVTRTATRGTARDRAARTRGPPRVLCGGLVAAAANTGTAACGPAASRRAGVRARRRQAPHREREEVRACAPALSRAVPLVAVLVTAVPVAQASAAELGERTLERGDRGDDVRALQQLLTRLDLDTETTASSATARPTGSRPTSAART